MIPLYKVNGHELQALTGEMSQFYEIKTPDLEGLPFDEFESVIKQLESDLIQSEGVQKIYHLSGKTYVNSFGEFKLSQGGHVPCTSPIETFLGSREAELNFYENYLTEGNEYIRLLSVKGFPEKIYPFEVCSYPDFVLVLRKVSKIEAKKKINIKRKIHFSAMFKAMRDIDSEHAYNEAEDVLERVSSDETTLFKCECYFILRSPTKLELDQETELFTQSFKGGDGQLRVEERGLAYLYQSLIPGVPAAFKRSLDITSDYASYWVPFHQDLIHSSGPSLKSRSGNVVLVNIFDSANINFNVLITGAAGQGKSMFANKLLQHQLSSGSKGVVLDLGNSFRKSALLHQGVVLSKHFNPMQFRSARYLKEFILAGIDEKMGKKLEGKLFEEIKIILETNEALSFKGLLTKLEMSFTGISFYFSELLEFFVEDDIEIKDFTYCDFSLYPESMKAPLIIYLIEYFKNIEGQKIFVFDECWHLLEKNAGYIAECFRTFRKHNASAVAISQNIDDFSQSNLGRVILQNTFTKFLFRQSIRESEFIDSYSKELVDSIHSKKRHYSEFLYLTEFQKKPLRYVPTPIEYEVFTTDPVDTNAFNRYMDDKGKFFDFERAITNYTKIKYALGEAV